MADDTRDRILDALEALLLDGGLSQFTLDAVAERAGVSKGGLLYHFPSKAALLSAMVRRLGQRSDAQMATALSGGTTAAQWYLQVPDAQGEGVADELALYRSTLAAMRTVEGADSEVHQALSEVMRGWDDAVRREVTDPVRAEIIRLVGDGLYFAALLELPMPDPELYQRVRAALLEG